MDQLFNTVVTQLPNFVGLVFALWIMARQNSVLTDALIKQRPPEDVRQIVLQVLKEQGMTLTAQAGKSKIDTGDIKQIAARLGIKQPDPQAK